MGDLSRFGLTGHRQLGDFLTMGFPTQGSVLDVGEITTYAERSSWERQWAGVLTGVSLPGAIRQSSNAPFAALRAAVPV